MWKSLWLLAGTIPTLSAGRDWLDILSAACALSLAIIGFFGVRYAKRTLADIKRQADLMEIEAKDARDAATASSNIAQGSLQAIRRQVAVAEETARRQLRAYMTVGKAYAIIHAPGNVEFYIGFRNCGQTPAYKFEGIRGSGLSVHPIPKHHLPIRHLEKSSGIIGAGGYYHTRFWTDPPLPLSRDELLEAMSNHQVLYMSGMFTYIDIFGDEHALNVQQIAGGHTNIRQTKLKDGPGEMSITLYNDSVGNEAD